jgi:hypothetical protein
MFPVNAKLVYGFALKSPQKQRHKSKSFVETSFAETWQIE